MENIRTELDTPTIKQKYLGDKGFIVFIAFLGAFIPLSTDIYLPALPRMVDNLHTTASMVNLTLVFFFLFYAIGTLFWGPLSDKYGRKPILLVGLSIYTIASIFCIFSTSVYVLIFFRILQSIGCGAATAVSTALIKDQYSGKKRVKILAIVQTMGTMSPVISPVIGAVILQVMSWRGVFIFLSVIGILSLAGSVAMEETNRDRLQGSIFKVIGRLGVVLKNKGFLSLLLTFSMFNIAFLAYISASSYIFVNGFGLSESVYSYYFAGNALFLMLGPVLYIQLSKRLHYKTIIPIAYIIISTCGLLMLTIGRMEPWIFFLTLIPASLCGNMIGPPRANLLLEQVHGDTGAASSLMSCGFTLFGSIGMLIISASTIDKVIMLGSMYFILGFITVIAWFVVSKQSFIKHI